MLTLTPHQTQSDDNTARVQWCIYSLNCPLTGDVRYIGWTKREPERRLNAHIGEARRGGAGHKSAWIRNLLEKSTKPTLTVIQRGSGPNWGAAEQYWIKYYREANSPLTNISEGGEGYTGPKIPEHRTRIAEANKGKPLSAERKAAISAAHKRRAEETGHHFTTLEHRKIVSASTKKRWEDYRTAEDYQNRLRKIERKRADRIDAARQRANEQHLKAIADAERIRENREKRLSTPVYTPIPKDPKMRLWAKSHNYSKRQGTPCHSQCPYCEARQQSRKK